MQQVGVIGLGDRWCQSYADAFKQLGRRVNVTAVYDSIASRADEVATSLRAKPVNGVRALAHRPDVDGIVVLETGWQKANSLSAIATIGKPVFLAEPLDLETVEYLHTIATMNRATWVPELAHRYCPATSRLMELMATQIGPPRKIEVTVPREQRIPDDELAELMDWCFYVLQNAKRVKSARIEQGGCAVRFETIGGGIADVSIHAARPGEVLARRVTCVKGGATLVLPTAISWTLSAEKKTYQETLTSERSATEFQLAIFLRRVAGGLLPVPDLTDLHRSMVAARHILSSWF